MAKKKQTPIERLEHAIKAVREYDTITAAEWRESYPDMEKTLRNRATGENSIQCLNRELLLRLAEYLASAIGGPRT